MRPAVGGEMGSHDKRVRVDAVLDQAAYGQDPENKIAPPGYGDAILCKTSKGEEA